MCSRKPVHVLQRGVDVNDIVNMAAALDAQEKSAPIQSFPNPLKRMI